MMKKLKILSIACVLVLASCESLFFEPDPSNDPVTNFEMLWNDFDQYYSFFELKGINWDSVYNSSRPAVHPGLSDDALFDIFEDMILALKDGHATLMVNRSKYIQYRFWSKYPVNRLPGLGSYLTVTKNSNSISSGIISGEIGYVRISTFGGEEKDFEAIDNVLSDFLTKNVKGLIVDVRGNGGGSDANSRLIAGRFTEEKTVYSYFRYRNGPSHSAFGPWSPKTVEPAGVHFDRRVMVLTNRGVYSASEDFVLAMKATQNAVIVGDTTGGGSGNPLIKALPNGWVYRIPRWQQVTPEMNSYEGTGIAPDIAVWISKPDSLAKKDTILERAIMEIRR
jgi:hypothetical protein